ncbi:MAG: hypothetical protein ACYCZV_03650 [Acidimicrobiales bacterium]
MAAERQRNGRWNGRWKSGGVRAVLGLAVIGLALAGCAGGNQAGALQLPAPVSGVVTARSPCQPGHACSFLVALVPGALVVANGKDGTHEARADAHGRYQLFLLEGVWTLQAARSATAPMGLPVRVDLSAGRAATVNLSAGS